MNIYNELINKNNKALSKAITLAESTLENDQRFISNLFQNFLKIKIQLESELLEFQE